MGMCIYGQPDAESALVKGVPSAFCSVRVTRFYCSKYGRQFLETYGRQVSALETLHLAKWGLAGTPNSLVPAKANW